MGIKDWNLTSNSNSSIDTINIAENAPFANMNDAVRAVMGNIRNEFAAMQTTVTAAALATVSGNGAFVPMAGATTITAFDTAVTGLYREVLAATTLILGPTTALGLDRYSGNVSLEPGSMVRARSLGAGNWVAHPQRSNGQPVTRYYEDEQAANVTAATIVDVSSALPFAAISGNTTIEGLATAVTGAYRELRVLGTPLLKHNGTSNIVPGSANFTLSANDLLRSRSLGAGNWIHKIDRAAGTPIASLTAYETGTFTPGMTFNGSATGVTGTLDGRYTRIGNICIARVRITLTNNGSGVGSALITGMPFTAAGGNTVAAMFQTFSGFASMTGAPMARIDSGGTTVGLFQATSTGQAQLTDTNVTDTAAFSVTVIYEV